MGRLLIRQAISSLYAVSSFQIYDSSAVASFTLVNKVKMLLISVLKTLAQ